MVFATPTGPCVPVFGCILVRNQKLTCWLTSAGWISPSVRDWVTDWVCLPELSVPLLLSNWISVSKAMLNVQEAKRRTARLENPITRGRHPFLALCFKKHLLAAFAVKVWCKHMHCCATSYSTLLIDYYYLELTLASVVIGHLFTHMPTVSTAKFESCM